MAHNDGGSPRTTVSKIIDPNEDTRRTQKTIVDRITNPNSVLQRTTTVPIGTHALSEEWTPKVVFFNMILDNNGETDVWDGGGQRWLVAV